MKIVGGYEQFINLPIPAFFEIIEALANKAELEEREAKKSRKRK